VRNVSIGEPQKEIEIVPVEEPVRKEQPEPEPVPPTREPERVPA
jgi:hypothetical protein